MLGAPMKELARVYVAAGAALLDEERPGWVDEVTRPVDVSSGQDCVLAQVFGDYILGLMRLQGANGSWAARHGFYTYNATTQRWPSYEDLTETWAVEIQDRRKVQARRDAERDALRAKVFTYA